MCSQRFPSADHNEGSSRLKFGVFSGHFQWNRLHVPPQRLSALERASIWQGADVHSLELVAVENVLSGPMDHDYTAQPSAGMFCC